ncbi:hypothetical protein FVEN_g13034 [Fusarium venenatum]|nr:hypothetical protein FVEN_g13034 [Fusarium venenatum]
MIQRQCKDITVKIDFMDTLPKLRCKPKANSPRNEAETNYSH